jgi:TolB-like protein
METSADARRPLRFASFELDLRSRELRTKTGRIRLQEQPFAILQMMLERPGDVVSREELRRRLWPNGIFVDFEHSLNAAVKRLRSALGDDADRPRFVETVPRRGYRFIANLDDQAERTGSVEPRNRLEVRLVVLPFTNLSDDPAQEYFSDGLTEELIAQLGATCRGRIGVIARCSSSAFKGTSMRAREIGETLRVGYLLEGSVSCDGDSLRITARLIESASETQLWCESYARNLPKCRSITSGRLSIQTDVASYVARSLALELIPSVVAPAVSPTLDVVGYESYLKRRYHSNNRGEEGLDDALTYTCVAPSNRGSGAGYAANARVGITSAECYHSVPRCEIACAHEAAL